MVRQGREGWFCDENCDLNKDTIWRWVEAQPQTEKSKRRKGGAFPHCAAAKPHWFIDWGTIGKALPHCAAAELLWFIELGVGKVRCYVRKNS